MAVTDEDFLRFKKAVAKRLKALDQGVSDIFLQIGILDDGVNQVADEAVEKANRAQRAVRRLKREFDEHEHDTIN